MFVFTCKLITSVQFVFLIEDYWKPGGYDWVLYNEILLKHIRIQNRFITIFGFNSMWLNDAYINRIATKYFIDNPFKYFWNKFRFTLFWFRIAHDFHHAYDLSTSSKPFWREKATFMFLDIKDWFQEVNTYGKNI